AQDDVVQEHVIEEIATEVLDKCSALIFRVEGLENTNVAQQLEIIKLKARVKKLERLNKVKSSKLRRLKKVGTSQRIESSDEVENVFNQGRISVDMETGEGIELEVDQELVHLFLLQSLRDPKEELHIDTPAETPTVKDKGKGILIEDPKPIKKKDQIEMDAEYAKKLQEELKKEHEEAYKQIDWNAAFDHVQAKETQYIKRYHGFKKKPQSESEAAKRRKLNEEAQEADDLRGRLEIVQDKDDDVFVEAIPLA
nr:hypothetical protein [Tanacetum cinerariifolium]